MISIREERAGEDSGVRDLNTAAFGRSVEGEIVDRLREACPDLVSLVAVDGERIVGHILFSPVTVERGPAGMVLAPLAVLPEYQRRGIGSALVEHGLAALRERGCPFVIVCGHPGYYPRFGFEPASARGLASHLGEVPDDVFMVLVLDADAMEGVGGRDPAAGRVRRSDEVGTAHPGDRSAGAGPAIGGGRHPLPGRARPGVIMEQSLPRPIPGT